MIISLCPLCAKKMQEFYIVDDIGAPTRIGACPNCCLSPIATLTQYDVVSKPKKSYSAHRRRSGGGERAKASK